MSTVNELLKEIRGTVKQVSASQKDEVKVMQAMLNDTSYEVGVYGKDGKIGTYAPGKEFRTMQANIIASSAKISKDEAASLVENYEVTKSDATAMVGISKEFVNTYLQTGRKLPLGGRETTNCALLSKAVEKTEKTFQKPVKNADGTTVFEPCKKTIPAHSSVKSKSSCPAWVTAK